ncbi:uncharacterized protein LOC131243331 isoform X2 [Magnolia sinica]|uniref:uncharacterized protein LOC131243331 isoform X2 n=1 Tax=Magnolia sinica TaxID=86752 RepID=UPI002657FEC7|nr:uncharacterized protein LOC131243331 isoform X2 [Magnolia sinica]
MESANSTKEMEPENQKKNANVYQIGGLPVKFPYKPYGSQLAFMGRVISTLDRAQRQGHCHALLESPTGTGKSLSLLCSALAWQQNHRSKNQHSNLSHPTPTPGPTPDPYLSGGGFVPEPDPSGNIEQSLPTTNNRIQRKRTTPTIYYASRTHSQISQVIREYRKTSYRVQMAVLASRKHYCTNKHVCMKENVDEECKLLLKDPNVGCHEFKNVHKLKAHPLLQKDGCLEAHDIEDLVKLGQAVKGCSYFAARSMATEAQLVFCPYTYIINPIIRRAMEVDIKGAIVILDEAHNIEDMARDAGSLDVEEEVLDILQTELGQLCLVDSVAMIYQPLYDVIQGIISWIGQRKDNLEKHGFERYSSCWTGDKALKELQKAGISQQCFPVLQECATKAVKAASEAELDGVHLSGKSAATVEGLFSSFSYFFSSNGHHALDYQLALQRYAKRDSGRAASGWTHCLSLWCLNPAVVFKEIADISLSVILTSGTLSPMNSFASELGVQFEACMEAPHVIDVESQLWAAVISTGPGNCQLNASYKTADGYAFQDALGVSLEEICKIVPGGALVFFPSYKLLEKLRTRWVQTGQWSRLNAQKSLFVEPRGNQEDFEPVLKGYYDSIRGKGKSLGQGAAPWKLKRNHKRDSKNLSNNELPVNFVNGAAFLAVCRGKVSEGIDFSDENARVVVIVGIPFPNKSDIQVVLKKRYNDTYKSSKNLLSGSEWYCHQAFRALNQAAGRCIRHRFDYGAIILIDERYKEERNIAFISKWLRKSIKQYESFDKSMEGLKAFFLDAKERFGQKSMNFGDGGLENSDINKDNMASLKKDISSKRTPRKRNQKINKHDNQNGRKAASDMKMPTAKTGQLTEILTFERNDDASLSHPRTQENSRAKVSIHTDEKDLSSCGKCINSRYSQKNSRWSETVSLSSSNSSPDQCAMTDNPTVGNNLVSPGVIPKDENSYSSMLRVSSPFSDRLSFHSATITNSSAVLSEGACTSLVTPERKVIGDFFNPEQESFLNSSVNSHSQKRRKPSQIRQLGSPFTEYSHIDRIRTMNISSCTDQKSELGSEANCPKCRNQLDVLRLTNGNSSALSTSSDLVINNKLHICCSACRKPLGLPENNFLLSCSSTSSSKTYLASLRSAESLSRSEPCSIQVLISDVSSVDQSLCNRSTINGTPQHGIWCEEDGCVFRTVCCPFCTIPETCLGLQVLATDASNVHLLNKVIFYADCLEIKNHEEESKEELRLPKRGLVCHSNDLDEAHMQAEADM